MNLVIVESPSKAKTIKKYLGKGYEVQASKGHVVDLPKSKISVDVENNYEPQYEITKKAVLTSLKKAYKSADKLILAVDLDREGEAIAWHIAQKLGAIDRSGSPKKGHDVERIVFSEITKAAIDDAIKNPRDLNMDLVNAQQARRILDRLVGYKLSPILWKKIAFGLSAGRVQSVALRLVVEKEEEREAFNPVEYWTLKLLTDESKTNIPSKTIILGKDDEKPKFNESLIPFDYVKGNNSKSELSKELDTKTIIDKISGSNLKIKAIDKREQFRNPKPPFITSTLQQTAINYLGFTSKKTMSVAQKLYEKGFITYMRTDSVSMSAQSVEEARKQIAKEFGKEYLSQSSRSFASKSKNAQEAHECIRPVNFALKFDNEMDDDMQKLYKLIRGRAIATQMERAKIELNSILGEVNSYEFKCTGSRILFDGFLKATNEKIEEAVLPNLKVGQELGIDTIFGEQHFTQPPARYSEASLIKKLEELGIGRPSTYSSIISTIIIRTYIEKEGKYLVPTLTGRTVNRLLTKYFGNVVDYGFTSKMEDNLDDIALGKLNWIKMLDEFYKPFEKTVKEKEESIPREEFTKIGKAEENIKCPICGAPMDIKLGRFGKFYSCSRWPDCKGMRDKDGLSDKEVGSKSSSEEFNKYYQPAPKSAEGKDYLLKKGKFGFFWAHPDYPKVKDARPLELKPDQVEKIYGVPPKTEKGKSYVLRAGKFGFFWAHPNYPKEKDIKRIDKKAVNQEELEKVKIENL